MSIDTIRPAELPVTSPRAGRPVLLGQRARLQEELQALDPEQWQAPTECRPWTVRDLVGHVVAGLAEDHRPVLLLTHAAAGIVRHRGRSLLDAVNEAQIDSLRAASPEGVLAELARLAPVAFLPPALHRVPMRAGGLPEGSDLAYVQYVIRPRDTWLHRHDIARATGGNVADDPTDTDVVEQVMRDLARSWTGGAVVLRLRGSGGGTFLLGSGEGPVVDVDVVPLMRHLSGRDPGTVLFTDSPAPVRDQLQHARVVF